MSYTVAKTAYIGKNVTIGDGTSIGHGTVIHDDTVIGTNVRIDENCVIGKKPLKSLNSAVTKDEQLSGCVIGDSCLIGTAVIVYRGANIGAHVLLADQAGVREKTTIGENTILGRGAYIENYCVVGKRCKIQSHAYITAHSTLGDDVFISPCVMTSNDNFMGRGKQRFDKFKGVTVKNGGRIGVGSVILPGKTIEEQGVVAAGSVVTKDVPAKTIVLGSPAKELRAVSDDQLLENQ